MVAVKVIVQKSEDAIKALHLLSNLTIKNIVNFLKENGPSPPSQIARGVNISPSTASRCLQELRKFNIVTAKWKTVSIDDRPLKIYRLVPNVLRFDFVLNEPKTSSIKPGHVVKFKGSDLVDFKDGDKKGIYASLESVPFKFSDLTASILKEAERNPSFKDLKDKFAENEEGFKEGLKRLLTLGLIEIEASEKA